MTRTPLFGGIELGGTKTVVAIGDAQGRLVHQARFDTTEPGALLAAIAEFIVEGTEHYGQIAGLGVGAFGPIVVDERAPNYGHLLATNKPGWSGFDLVGALRAALNVPIRLVTDVAAAGLAEAHHGHLRGVAIGLYLTIGTGIGGAVLHNGVPLPALLHPEMGHLPLVRMEGDRAPSTCAFHTNCAEGLVAGPAIAARFGAPLNHFDANGPQYALAADYIGQLLASLQLALSPQRIIIGGGVAQADGLLPLVRPAMQRHLGGYIDCKLDDPDFIVSPMLGAEAGVIGAIAAAALSHQEIAQPRRKRA